MIVPKLTKLDNSIIPYMYEIGWRLITIYNEIMYWESEVKNVRTKKEVSEKDDFTAFWNLYPKERRKKKETVNYIYPHRSRSCTIRTSASY